MDNEAPNAMDPASGFKVKHSDLRRQWDGEYVYYRFLDKRNSQDFVRGVPDGRPLRNARPEPADTFLGTNEVTADSL